MFEQLANKLSLAPEIEVQSEKNHLLEQEQNFNTSKKLKHIIDEIVNGDFVLYYQPKVNNKLEFDSFEALLRLRKADGNIVGPYFLGHLDNAGLSEVIDLWVIEKIKTDLEHWQQQHFYPKISINLNPYMLANQSMINKLITDLAPFTRQTEIEILETAYVENFMQIRENIDTLNKFGIKTAIDDFGSGFSSLSLLYKLNVDTIKIDRSILLNIKTQKGRVLV